MTAVTSRNGLRHAGRRVPRPVVPQVVTKYDRQCQVGPHLIGPSAAGLTPDIPAEGPAFEVENG